jgi:hypothetical protein
MSGRSGKPKKVGFWITLGNAIALHSDFYEHARNTRRNHRIALTIVILAAISHVLGSAVILLINRATLPVLSLALLLDGLSVVGGYYLWSWIVLKVGQWLKPVDPTYQDLLIPVGFAYAPQVLNVLTLVPLLGRPIELILSVWSLLAVIVAVRQALDISTRRAIAICLIGWTPIQVAIGALQVLEQSFLLTSSSS